jgi:hypothetical protein
MKIIICIILFSIPFASQSMAGEDIDFTGFGAAGFLFIDQNPLTDANQSTYYIGKFQAEIEFNDEIEAQLDLRGNSVTNNIIFREFSAKFKYFEHMRFKVGNIKRLFGYEYVANREDLLTTNRSVMQNNLSIRGFGVRSVSIMAYYNYSKKRPDFPYSYAISAFQDNSMGSGLALRGAIHKKDFNVGLSYIFQNRGGNYPIAVHGISLESVYESKNKSLNLGIAFIQDPLRGQEILAANDAIDNAETVGEISDETVYSAGAVLSGSLAFDLDARIIKKIEPLFLLSTFVADIKKSDNHVLQGLVGVNFYFTKKVRFRINMDLRLTKSEYDESGKYATNGSRAIAEVQVKF